jgi:hypothetical protein
MTPIRFFMDEDVHGEVAAQLRALGLDSISTPEPELIVPSIHGQYCGEGRVFIRDSTVPRTLPWLTCACPFGTTAIR